ncbi:hypothetical protein PV433_29970 [Paenibacillus sp. GYB004]|uniref:hypothetical protein n=1 Tax=Paenibacillus sp. GYB004 TaxID=2994393 RepID=UPI002F962B6D
MGFVYKMILYLLIVGLTLVTVILDHADTKNQMYAEMALTEAILKAPPYGYITDEIQNEVKEYLEGTRGMKREDIQFEGTLSISERKVKGTGDEKIELRITYPRTILIFFGGVIDKPIVSYRFVNTEYRTP